MPSLFSSLFSTSKAASYSITQALRDVLKDQGTYVVSVHPGPITTDMSKVAGFGDGSIGVPDAIFDEQTGDLNALPVFSMYMAFQ